MSTFKEGYEGFIGGNSAYYGAYMGNAYVESVQSEIDRFVETINNSSRKNLKIDALKGFDSEYWQAGTFNINAAAKGLKVRAVAPDDNGLVDIVLTSGEKYQVKYYKNGSSSAAQQAKTNMERYKEYVAQYRSKHNGQDPPISMEEYIKDKFPNDPYYMGQGRLIPTDQMKEAREWLQRKILEESNGGRPEQVKRYKETLEMLTDRLKSADGAESIPLTEKESRELARLAKEGGFDPEKWGLTTEKLITNKYIMEQAFKSGLTAAMISAALKIAPEICGMIYKLAKGKKVGAEEFKQLALSTLKGSAEGFVRGTVSAAITVSCEAGKLGSVFKGLNPTIIGAFTAITMNTIHNACLLSFGKISKNEFAGRCRQDVAVTASSMQFGAMGAAISSALFTPAASIFGYMIGSFVGSILGSYFDRMSRAVIEGLKEQGRMLQEYYAEIRQFDMSRFVSDAAYARDLASRLKSADSDAEINLILRQAEKDLGLSSLYGGEGNTLEDAMKNPNWKLIF